MSDQRNWANLPGAATLLFLEGGRRRTGVDSRVGRVPRLSETQIEYRGSRAWNLFGPSVRWRWGRFWRANTLRRPPRSVVNHNALPKEERQWWHGNAAIANLAGASEGIGTHHAAGAWRYLGNNPKVDRSERVARERESLDRLKPIHRVTRSMMEAWTEINSPE